MTDVEKIRYDNQIVRNFAIATLFWGGVGMILGLWIALQLSFPWLNVPPYFTFGRLRPLHTNAAIFAFVGNAIFMGVYHSLQRLCKTRMYSDTLSKIHFWGWQLIILGAAITLLLGITTSKEYAELEWPLDIAITIIWVVFGINMLGTIAIRRVKHIYVAIWFYIATFLAVAILHVFNSLEIPVSLFKSYSIYAGVQDALVQWWYGHNAVAFFLTTPYLGLMYYYLPKAANRPVYSYRLSVIHFWALVFIYIWAGPHHLLYSAVPDWAQVLGVTFSVMLIAPSWGGMLNGLLTLRGAWDRLRTNPELKFMVVAVTCYGMATLEGPLMSLKSVNALVHFTDWVIGHVHNGTLGWNGFLTFGILYWLIPRLYKTEIYSKKLMNLHFWIGTLGIVFYVASMYASGITQGLMWKEVKPDGMLQYPNFLQTVLQIIPMYYLRALGGSLYLLGFFIMVYNLIQTMKQGEFQPEEEVLVPAKVGTEHPLRYKLHRFIESHSFLFTVLCFVAVAVGGILELIPAFLLEYVKPTKALVTPYTPLELEGRDIYIRESCNACHSQMIRPFYSETTRFGAYSKAGEYVYEHPFLWGSKRTGPDLLRVGKRLPDPVWHYKHLEDPTSTSPGSIMPAYPHLITNKLDYSHIRQKMRVLMHLGVPYKAKDILEAEKRLKEQAMEIAKQLKKGGIQVQWDREIIALIAYLKALGTKEKKEE